MKESGTAYGIVVLLLLAWALVDAVASAIHGLKTSVGTAIGLFCGSLVISLAFIVALLCAYDWVAGRWAARRRK